MIVPWLDWWRRRKKATHDADEASNAALKRLVRATSEFTEGTEREDAFAKAIRMRLLAVMETSPLNDAVADAKDHRW